MTEAGVTNSLSIGPTAEGGTPFGEESTEENREKALLDPVFYPGNGSASGPSRKTRTTKKKEVHGEEEEAPANLKQESAKKRR